MSGALILIYAHSMESGIAKDLWYRIWVNKKQGHENRCPPGIGTEMLLYSCKSKV